MSINDRLEAAALKAEGGSEIMRRFANDPAGTYVPTESGPLPSLAEWLDLNQDSLSGVPALQQMVDALIDAADLTKGAYLLPWSRTALSASITSTGAMLSSQWLSVWEFANLITDKPAPSDPDTWDWQPAIQGALNALSPGGTLLMPAGRTYRVVNATGVGVDIVARRSDALANGTLYALTCSTDDVVIRIDGEVHGTSALDDIFRLTGQGVSFTGSGTVRSVSGEFLDTNSQSDPLVQWFPSLVRLDGNRSGSRGLTYHDQPTVGLNLRGDDCWADGNVFIGGPVAHGAGTIQFGIYAGISNVARYRHIITRNQFGRAPAGGACYSGVFCVAKDSIFAYNTGKSLHEHLIYNYGAGSKILYNDIDDAGLASGFQNFAEDVLIQGNTAKNCAGGLQTMHNGGVRILDNDFSLNISLSAIAIRTYSGAGLGLIEKDVVVSRNTVAVTGVQSPIDVVVSTGILVLKITDNIVSGGPIPGASGKEANIKVTSTAAAGMSSSLDIRGNTHRDSAGYAITVTGFSQLKIAGEAIRDANAAAGDLAIILFNCAHGEVFNCTVQDTRTTKRTSRIAYAGSADGNANISCHNNNGVGLLSSTNALCTVPTGEIAWGNQQNSLGSIGYFTMPNASGLAINTGAAAGCCSPAKVVISPINSAAWALQASANRIYPSGSFTGSFNVSTESGSATGSATAQFKYEIIQ